MLSYNTSPDPLGEGCWPYRIHVPPAKKKFAIFKNSCRIIPTKEKHDV
jgi:hypothetical protein